jgi:hypothetical protein
LAYRIYNLLTDKSLRVRLARITYRDVGRRNRSIERYAFFTEHFDSLAARHDAEPWPTDDFLPQQADARELALLELFQYLIGNTDWSALKAHNITHIRNASGSVTAVPYDFDFAGLVNAAYAAPSPKLPIRRVTQRLFRGLCRPEWNWEALFASMQERRDAIMDLVERAPGLEVTERVEVRDYLAGFFRILDSPTERQSRIVATCRG